MDGSALRCSLDFLAGAEEPESCRWWITAISQKQQPA